MDELSLPEWEQETIAMLRNLPIAVLITARPVAYRDLLPDTVYLWQCGGRHGRAWTLLGAANQALTALLEQVTADAGLLHDLPAKGH